MNYLACAFLGSVGLPIVMWISWLLPTIFLPNLFDIPVNTGRTTLVSSDIAFCFVTGAILGLSSAMLYGDRRYLGPRLISTGSVMGVGLFLFYVAKRDFPSSTQPEIRSEAAFFLPMLLWLLALFFFAVVARRRPIHP